MPRIKKGRKAVGAGKKKAKRQEVQISEADSEVETYDNVANIVDGSLSEEDGMNGNSLEMVESSESEEIDKSPPKKVSNKGKPKKTKRKSKRVASMTLKSARAPVPTKKVKLEESKEVKMPRIKKGRKAVGAGKKKAKPEEIQMSEADSEEVGTDDNAADLVDGSLSEEDGMNGNSLEMGESSESEEIEKSPRPKMVSKRGKSKKTKRKSKRVASMTLKSARAPVPTKKTKLEESESEVDAEYEVEQILETRILKNKTKEFYVKWKGYPYSECTWEPESNMSSSQTLVSAFLAQLKKK